MYPNQGLPGHPRYGAGPSVPVGQPHHASSHQYQAHLQPQQQQLQSRQQQLLQLRQQQQQQLQQQQQQQKQQQQQQQQYIAQQQQQQRPAANRHMSAIEQLQQVCRALRRSWLLARVFTDNHPFILLCVVVFKRCDCVIFRLPTVD